ncbi:helix-turn-helix transcriptional regulator [Nocardia sp. BMG51109]|uniref:helix-turn-helix domain-containing protein n=1 Tax=Nocardia sp. BMG51109 TaxID=1056816 RepID=UPI0004647552|nr:helix-turn-helix transcriptional regulator [Nocardia sp. BMG51109]
MIANDDPEDTETTLPRRQLGRLMRESREATGMTTDRAGMLIGVDKSTISRLERGRTGRVQMLIIKALCDLYGVDAEKRAVIMDLAQQKPVRSWWSKYSDVMTSKYGIYVQLEAAASEIAVFQSLIVPGLAQTRDYATAVNQRHFDDPAELERSVSLRLKRQHLVTRNRNPLHVHMIITESVVRTTVGSPATMAAQTRHLADLGTLDNVTVQVLPMSSGLPVGAGIAPFVIVTFPRDGQGKPIEPTTVYAESHLIGDVYLERREDVRQCRSTFHILSEASLDDRASRALLREVAQGYDRYH